MKLFINGSPKLDKSNSFYFLSMINDNSKIRFLYKDDFDDILRDINKISTIIFSFPLYVDGPPNKVIEFMEYINDNKIDIKDKKIYCIINCGFFEAKQNEIAALIIKNFAINNRAKYMGSFNIGAGEIVGKRNRKILYKIISIPFYFKIKKFKNSINKGLKVNLNTTIRPMSKKLYVFLANISWRKKMRENKIVK